MTERTVLVIEDDPFALEWVEQIVQERFGASVRVVCFHSEKEFLARLEELRRDSKGIAAAVVDMLVPWEDGTSNVDRPDLVPSGDDAEAGVRILAKLRGSTEFARLPILIYSVNDSERQPIPDELTLHTEYMRKDAPDERFLDWLNRRLNRH